MPPKKLSREKLKDIFADTWKPLEESLNEVLGVLRDGKAPAGNKMRNQMGWYTLIYDAATKDQNLAHMIYVELGSWIKKDLEANVTSQARELAQRGESDALFRFISKSFQDFRLIARYSLIVFRYLDQYLTQRQNHDKLEKMFLKAFNEAVYENVKKELMNVIIRIVNSGREGNRIDRKALQAAVDIFNSVGTATASSNEEAEKKYHADFEKFYMRALEDSYNQKASARLSTEGGHYVFLEWVDSRFSFEETLARELLKESSLNKVIETMERCLLRDHQRAVILHEDSGFKTLLQDNKEADLRRMFRLFKRVPNNEAVKTMAGEQYTHLLDLGSKIVEQFRASPPEEAASAVEKAYIESCLNLYDMSTAMFSSLFEGHILFKEALTKAFNKFVNENLERKEKHHEKEVVRKTNASEILASYVDSVMKNEYKDITDPDQELERLEKLTVFFTHLKEKDIFQEYYKAKLAKRLLQTTPNEDLEKAFLEKLQRQMGKSFTHKMEGMINDRDSTKKMSERFQDDAASQRLGKTSFNVQILTAGHWPAYKTDALEPCTGLRDCITAFTHFYKKAYATRTLNWIHMLGSATMSVSFPKGTKEVTGSTYQACILSLVDEAGLMKVGDIATNMKLDSQRLVKPQIASMYLSKMFPLLCLVDESGEPQPAGRGIADDNILAINKAFTHKTRRFKLPVPSHTAQQGMPTDPELEARRKVQIDACIVRVMKSRRTLHYTELLDACIAQLMKLFTPQPKMIKQRVEDLITRGYLKRDADDSAKFEYLA